MVDTEVTVRGRIGNSPELQSAPGKKPWLRLRVATNRRLRQGDGWVDGPTSWYDVKVWDDFARNVAESLRKGDAIVVQGSLFIEEYQNESGVTLRTPVIHAQALGPDLRSATARIARVNRAVAEQRDGDGRVPAQPVDVSGMAEIPAAADPVLT
ncbi:MAG: single-stranded DNA-binding protein [Beutenbergiaceae bacterium]